MSRAIRSLATALLVTTGITGSALAFGPETFQTTGVSLDNIVGRIAVEVVPGASGMTVSVTGNPEYVSDVRVTQQGDRLVIEQEQRRDRNYRDDKDGVIVTLSVPEGAAVTVEDFTGEARIGDLRGPLTVKNGWSGDLMAGAVTTAELRLGGSGSIVTGPVSGPLFARINGSGDIETGPVAQKAEIEVSGSGDVEVGTVSGPVAIGLSGSGEIEVGGVEGALAIAVSGSGDVRVASGRADPLTVTLSGSGDVVFGGTASSQTIRQSGSGEVRIGSR